MKMTGKLRPLPDGGTEVTGTSDISITGLLAQFGSLVVQDVSNQMFAEFSSSLQQTLQSSQAPAVEEPAKPPKPLRALPLLIAAIRNSIHKFFRHKTVRP